MAAIWGGIASSRYFTTASCSGVHAARPSTRKINDTLWCALSVQKLRAAVFHWFLKVFRLRFLTTRFRRAIMSAPFFCSPGGFLCHNGGANSVPRHAGKTIGRQKFDGLVQGEKMHPQKMSFAEIRGFPRSRRRFGDPFKRRVSLILRVGDCRRQHFCKIIKMGHFSIFGVPWSREAT